MEFIKYKINRYGITPIYGVLLHEGNQWIVTKDNVVDYVLDGIRFTNTDYIRHRKVIERSTMEAQIISMKYIDFQEDCKMVRNICLDDYCGVFHAIMNQHQLIEIGLDKSECVFVGTVSHVNEKSFIVETIDTMTNFSQKMRIPYKTVRYFKIKTDYLNSLELFIRSNKENLNE